MGLIEEAYSATNREADERMLIAALSSMELRTDVRETVLSVDSEVFFSTVHGSIWRAAKKLAADDRLMLFDNFKPLLTEVEQRKLQELFGRPVRKIELTTAVELVTGAAKRRRLIDGLKQIAARASTSDQYEDSIATAHEVLTNLDQTETSSEAVTIGEALDEFWDDVANPKPQAEKFATPWAKLDESYLSGGHARGELVTWMAPTGGGKSIALLQTAATWAMAGKRIAIFSLEMGRNDVVNRILSTAGNTRIRDIANRNLDAGTRVILSELTEALHDKRVQIFDSGDFSMNEIRQQCNVMARTGGLDAVFIDYVQIVEPGGEDSRERQVSEIVRQMKQIAREGVVVVTASQQNDQGDRPSKNSARESKAIVMHSDCVLALHHERDSMGASTGMVDVVVVKNRRGPEGAVAMSWCPHVSSIAER